LRLRLRLRKNLSKFCTTPNPSVGLSDEEGRRILLELGLKKIEEKEKDDFIPLGYRRRTVKTIPTK